MREGSTLPPGLDSNVNDSEKPAFRDPLGQVVGFPNIARPVA
jgi:hypothetical protein